MTENLTQVLKGIKDPDEASEAILPLVYNELRAIAAVQLRGENPGHTLMTTDLVHEAYIRMFEGGRPEWNDRKHFFASAALAIRRILVDHARRKRATKRTDPEKGLTAEERMILPAGLSQLELLDLDAALNALETLDERQHQIVHYRVFAGLTVNETAQLMEISERTVAREWFSAKAWLQEQITP